MFQEENLAVLDLINNLREFFQCYISIYNLYKNTSKSLFTDFQKSPSKMRPQILSKNTYF